MDIGLNDQDGGAGQRILDNFRGFSTTRPAASSPMSAAVLLERLNIRVTSEGEAPTKVDLAHKCITAHEARILAEPLGQNRVVCLKLGYNQLRDAGTAAVASVLPHHPSLEVLDLGFNDIGDEGAMALGTSLCSNKVLKTLYLSGNRIGLDGIKAICTALESNYSLSTLHLTGNRVLASGAEALATAVENQQQALSAALAVDVRAGAGAEGKSEEERPMQSPVGQGLQRLYLSGAQLGVQGALAMARAVSTTSNLTELYLSDNAVGDKGVEALGEALSTNRKVQVVELAFNNLGPAGVEPFLRRTFAHPSLTSLNLGNNRIGDRGAQLVAACLPSTILETLDLGFNSICCSGMKALMHAILCCPRLQTLTLSGNSLDTEGAKALAFALSRSSTLKQLFIDHTGVSLAGERHIAAGIMANKQLSLQRFTGFRLGAAVVSAAADVPKPVEELTNDHVLAYLRQPWEFGQNKNSSEESKEKHDDREGARRLLLRRQERQRSSSAPLRLLCENKKSAVLGVKALAMEGAKHQRHNSADETKNQSKFHQRFLDVVMNGNDLQVLQQMAQASYSASELWELHQYFFSPPLSVCASVDDQTLHCSHGPQKKETPHIDPNILYQRAILLSSKESQDIPLSPGKAAGTTKENEEMTDIDRPSKRLCAASVKMRIAYYPRIQDRLNVYKKEQNQEGILILLRQLKYLEGAAATHMISGNNPQSETILLDIEAIMLEML